MAAAGSVLYLLDAVHFVIAAQRCGYPALRCFHHFCSPQRPAFCRCGERTLSARPILPSPARTGTSRPARPARSVKRRGPTRLRVGPSDSGCSGMLIPAEIPRQCRVCCPAGREPTRSLRGASHALSRPTGTSSPAGRSVPIPTARHAGRSVRNRRNLDPVWAVCAARPCPGPRGPGPARLPLLQSESAAGLPRPPCMTRPPEILTSPLSSGLPFARRHQPDSVPDRRRGPRGTACSASPEHRNVLPASPTGQGALLSRME